MNKVFLTVNKKILELKKFMPIMDLSIQRKNIMIIIKK